MNSPLDPIRRGSLPAELVDRLRTLIVQGELPPGAKVSEQALCERFGVSRTPLREALRELASERLVTLTPRRGAAIAPFTAEDLQQTFPVLGALEALAGETACRNISDAQIEQARVLQAELEQSHAEGDLARYSKANAETHLLILKAAKNETLSGMVRGLDARVRRARYLVNMSPERWAAAVDEHKGIFAALEKRDGPLLGRLLKAHIANKLASICAQLEEKSVSETPL